jgi:F0F1-type ATP synthase delta subunit
VQQVYTDFLLQANYREVQKLTSKIYAKFSTQSVATVRSPSPLPLDTKRDIRKHFPHGVIFEIHPDLVGGILLYRDSTITDNSFASFLSRIHSLSS